MMRLNIHAIINQLFTFCVARSAMHIRATYDFLDNWNLLEATRRSSNVCFVKNNFLRTSDYQCLMPTVKVVMNLLSLVFLSLQETRKQFSSFCIEDAMIVWWGFIRIFLELKVLEVEKINFDPRRMSFFTLVSRNFTSVLGFETSESLFTWEAWWMQKFHYKSHHSRPLFPDLTVLLHFSLMHSRNLLHSF